jgi:hypothetical protein
MKLSSLQDIVLRHVGNRWFTTTRLSEDLDVPMSRLGPALRDLSRRGILFRASNLRLQSDGRLLRDKIANWYAYEKPIYG